MDVILTKDQGSSHRDVLDNGRDMTQPVHEIWDLWFPDAAAQGLSFARGRLQATERLLVHAAPEILSIDVRSDDGDLLARAERLKRTGDYPISRLTREGGRGQTSGSSSDCQRMPPAVRSGACENGCF